MTAECRVFCLSTVIVFAGECGVTITITNLSSVLGGQSVNFTVGTDTTVLVLSWISLSREITHVIVTRTDSTEIFLFSLLLTIRPTGTG